MKKNIQPPSESHPCNQYVKNYKDVTAKTLFDHTKSDYFLMKIFEILKEKKRLEVLKYIKHIQNKINLNINNYKEYSEKYSSIEIELTLYDDRYGKLYN